MSLKKLLAYTQNFRIQANTSRLPTSYPAHLFGRAENEPWGRCFYVDKGTLIIAFTLMVGVNNTLIIYPLQIAIFNLNFYGYLWIKTVFDVDN